MTAEEYWKDKFPAASENNLVLGFADAYATYRLQFEREQQQNGWMPTEEEWKRVPEAKWAAMDSDGEVWLHRSNPTPKDYTWSVGNDLSEYIKAVDPTNFNWRQCKVARPEGV